ncbi:alpha/beta hydrolase [Nocardia sp. NPDC059180]|uniref:alpha/beta hydrolase n=1 Tax=Nocardia sp. NPDC059180 TaxID=3346761 RepID=UPI0036B9263B
MTELNVPTISRVRSWNPDALIQVATEWETAQSTLTQRMRINARTIDESQTYFSGHAGNAMRNRYNAIDSDTAKLIRALDTGATAARTAASDLSSHRDVILGKVSDAAAAKYMIADDGTVTATKQQWTTLLASSNPAAARLGFAALTRDAQNRTTALKQALADLATADVRAETAIIEALKDLPGTPGTAPAGTTGQTPTSPAFDARPDQNRHWWNQLTPDQQRAIVADNPSLIGNRDGIPAAARDQANRNRIPELRTQLESAQTTAAATYGKDSEQYTDITNRIKDLDAVEHAIGEPGSTPPRKLMVLDVMPGGGRQSRAAIAVGDPDTADHISVTTPGLNTTVRESIGSMGQEAQNMRDEAQNQLRQTPGREQETVSTIAWIGYDAPQIRSEDLPGKIEGGIDVGTTERAQEGAVALARFYNGLEAAHNGGEPPHITAVGHSYGSLTTGLALQQPGGHPVTDMVVYGSPGIAADSPGDLGLATGHAYVMRTDDDPIERTHDWSTAAQAGPLLPGPLKVPGMLLPGIAAGYAGTDHGGFGPDPAEVKAFTRLEAGPAITDDGRSLEGASGHSDYPRPGETGIRTTVYNTAAIIAGLAGNAVRE